MSFEQFQKCMLPTSGNGVGLTGIHEHTRVFFIDFLDVFQIDHGGVMNTKEAGIKFCQECFHRLGKEDLFASMEADFGIVTIGHQGFNLF